MNSEKVKEIKNNIIICSTKIECKGCSLFPNMKSTNCRNKLLADALTLISELESENETLRNAKVVYETVDYCYEDLKKAEKRIAELEKVYDRQVRIINDLNIEVVKEQKKLPKFAEKLKDKAIRRQEFIGELAIDDIEYVKTQDIDETLKEFIK